MSEDKKGDQKPPELALREEGISLADYLKILSRKNRGKTAQEIIEKKSDLPKEKPTDGEKSSQEDLK